MNDTAPQRPRSCGLRISLVDVAAIGLCVIATWIAWRWVGQLALLAPLVLGHFFLFCNVFRIRRRYELIWAGIFIANFFVQLFRSGDGSVSLLALLATQLPVTVFFIWKEFRSERYHGIGCRRTNPDLERYLAGEIR